MTHIHVVHVIGAMGNGSQEGATVPSDLTQESERLREHVEQMLVRHTERVPGDYNPSFERLTTHVRLYGTAESISQLAADLEADLVVVGTHGRRGVARLLLGSVAEATVRLAPCPVLVVRPRGSTAGTVIPKIEPACQHCLETRRITDGKDFWCEQHDTQHERRHTYHFDSDRPSHQSGLLIRV